MTRNPPQPTDELVNHVTQILGAKGEDWLRELPGKIAELESRWNIETGEVFAAGEFNFVAAAVRDESEPVVLKIAPPYPDNEAYSEAAYIRYKNGDGCVRLLAEDRDSRAMLLERALPGKNLAEIFAGRPAEMIEPGVEVLRRIAEPAPRYHPDQLSLDRWFAGLDEARNAKFPADFAKKALELYESLKTERPAGYLHGDFHPGNIVSATRSPLLVIDPKGLIGHIGYDISVYLNNLLFIHRDKTDLARAVRSFAGAIELPESHVRGWAYAGWVIGQWWSFRDMPDSYIDDVATAEFWME
jgi:streptomycin 6-kinase